MRKVYFDTETTDLTPGQIAQLSYIIEDDSTFVEAKNMFFTVDKMTSGAEGTHGMSVDFLAEASNGMTILDRLPEIAKDFNGSTIIAHNVAFDTKFLSMEFWRGKTEFSPQNTECTMKFFTSILKLPKYNGRGYKYPKLCEVMDYLKVDSDKVAAFVPKIFTNLADAPLKNVSFHDATFDTVAMWVCINVYKERQMSGDFWTTNFTRG